MKRTVFNYQLKEDIPIRDFEEIIHSFKEGHVSIKEFSDTITQKMKTIFDEDKELDHIIKIAKQTHVLLHLISDNNALLSLPWQVFFDQYPLIGISKGNRPINNYAPANKGTRLSILIMFSSPLELVQLDIKKEIQSLLSGFLSSYDIQVKITDDGSLTSLEKALTKQAFDIIYYSGHGSYENGETILSFETPLIAKETKVSGKVFVDSIINNCQILPKVVILSSCNTTHEESGFKGVTSLLLQNKIPAVISFSDTIEQEYATEFCYILARQLSKKYDLLDAFRFSVNVLKEQFTRKKEKQAPWLKPQLFLQKHIEQFIGNEEVNSAIQEYSKCFIETKQYFPFIYREEIIKITNAIKKGNTKINIAGHRGMGKSACMTYIWQNINKFTSNYSGIYLSDKHCTLDHLKQEVSKLIKEPVTDLFKDISDFASKYPLVIVIDHVDQFVTLENNEFIIEHAVVEFLKKVEHISVVLITRFPIKSFSIDESIILKGVTMPHLELIFRDSFLGTYVKKKFLNRNTTSVFSNDPLYLIFVELHTNHLFSSIPELYIRFEKFLSEGYNKGVKVYENESEFLKTYDHIIDKTLKIYELEIEPYGYGYRITPYLKKLSLPFQKILKTLSHIKIPVGREILECEEIINLDSCLNTLISLNLVERDTLESGDSLYWTTSLLSNVASRKLEVKNYLDKKELADYLEEFFEERRGNIDFIEKTRGVFTKYLKTAFYLYVSISDIEMIKDVGVRLCNFYNRSNSPYQALRIGEKVFEELQENTPVAVFELLSKIYRIKGQEEKAHFFLKKQREQAIIQKSEFERIDVVRSDALRCVDSAEFKKASEKFDQALQLVEKYPFENKEVRMLKTAIQSDSVYTLRRLNKYKEAEQRLKDAYSTLGSLNEDPTVILDNLCALYDEIGEFDNALYYLEKTLIDSNSKKFNNKRIEISALLKQGSFYERSHQFMNAKIVLGQAIHLAKLNSDRVSQAQAYMYIGNVFLTEGELFELKGYESAVFFEDALHYYDQAEVMYKDMPNTRLIHQYSLYSFMSGCFAKLQMLDKSGEYSHKQLEIAKRTEDVDTLLNAYRSLIGFYAELDEIETCFKYYEIHQNIITTELNRCDNNPLKQTLLRAKMQCLFSIANLYDRLKNQEQCYEKSIEAFTIYFENDLRLTYVIERHLVLNANYFLRKGFKSPFRKELQNLILSLGGKYLN
ncbi:CHAT domain-containing protein [Aquimarina megaterium]|uniref:CHAT domain-containing protein n=1 Tax=Aquimarina megaterium TaxID=1443666 RepID=UPI0004728359|nr:CHAT domain-containing protein [Aquimarina megaterium]